MVRCLRPFWLGALVVVIAAAGCGGAKIRFHYPSESLVYPRLGAAPPTLYVDFINDLRPESQRTGAGRFTTIRFPADENWELPVNQIYYQAVVQDLTQTDLVEVVPLRSQADYFLEVDLEHLGCRVSRRGGALALLAAGGGALTYALTQSVGAAVAGAVIAAGAVPVPTEMRAVCQVKLRVFDQDQELFFERTCLGEVSKEVWEGATARKDQEWVDAYLAVAVKRCNACLLGQLRQALLEAGEDLETLQ
jgi:hypothetical protein